MQIIRVLYLNIEYFAEVSITPNWAVFMDYLCHKLIVFLIGFMDYLISLSQNKIHFQITKGAQVTSDMQK